MKMDILRWSQPDILNIKAVWQPYRIYGMQEITKHIQVNVCIVLFVWFVAIFGYMYISSANKLCFM
jgi:hypothetical protein